MLNKLLPKGSKIRKKAQEYYYNWLVPRQLSPNFIQINEQQTSELKNSLTNHFTHSPESLEAQLQGLNERLSDHRLKIIPWLESIQHLRGARILEIGCGNGTSTVALAEQGAIVTAIDIDEPLLADAKNRCAIYNLSVEFHLMNATEVAALLPNKQFDMIIFYAVLEHMTYKERLSAVKSTFDMLQSGGFWAIIDTPNRLHFYDSHTAMMPFFHWLPDELALKYTQFSDRSEFKNSFAKVTIDEDKKLEFARWGRGMSFHEFELSLMPVNRLQIVSTLSQFLTKRSIVYYFLEKITPNARFIAFFKKQYPQIHEGFFQPYLNIIIRK